MKLNILYRRGTVIVKDTRECEWLYFIKSVSITFNNGFKIIYFSFIIKYWKTFAWLWKIINNGKENTYVYDKYKINMIILVKKKIVKRIIKKKH